MLAEKKTGVPHFSRFSRSGSGGWPESLRLRDYATCKAEFESLHHGRGSLLLGLADQEMDVLRHDHVTQNDELIASSDLLQHSQKQVATSRRADPGLPAITTARDEM